jgi:hypothetical protein
MLCAITEAIECGYEEMCISGPAEEVNLPPFITFDPKSLTLSEHRGTRSTSVERVVQKDGALVVRGFENRAFNLSVSQSTGRLSAAAIGPDAGFVFFGVCTNP